MWPGEHLVVAAGYPVSCGKLCFRFPLHNCEGNLGRREREMKVKKKRKRRPVMNEARRKEITKNIMNETENGKEEWKQEEKEE